MKYVKQLRKLLKTKNDQHTATKAWSDYIVIFFLKNELNLRQEASSIYRY